MIGEKPEQSQPTEPEQCFLCVATWVWISVTVKAVLEDVEAAAAQKPSAVAETATMARVSIVFFIGLYPYSCRAQLLSSLFALYEKFSLEVTQTIQHFL